MVRECDVWFEIPQTSFPRKKNFIFGGGALPLITSVELDADINYGKVKVVMVYVFVEVLIRRS